MRKETKNNLKFFGCFGMVFVTYYIFSLGITYIDSNSWWSTLAVIASCILPWVWMGVADKIGDK